EGLGDKTPLSVPPRRRSSLLAAANITKYHGPQLVLSDVTLVVPPDARVGLVGRNGVGKSTLLRILAGLEEPDRGTVRGTPPGLAVDYLPQEEGLHSASGGEVARARLATFLRRPLDVFLLDEPTNDLDFGGLDWLEREVAKLRGAVVLISHDREFLDRTVSRIVELDEWTHGATDFSGGWSEYERARSSALRRQHEAYEQYETEKERLEEQMRRMERWEERGYGQGRKKKRTKDVKKRYGGRIDRLEQAEKPYEPWELRIPLSARSRSGDVVLRLEDAVAERGSFTLGPLDLALGWGDRVAISGPNGSGKSTLIDVVLGRLPLSSGRLSAGSGVVLGELTREPPGPADPLPHRATGREHCRAVRRHDELVDAAGDAASLGIRLVVAEQLARMPVPAVGEVDAERASDDRPTALQRVAELLQVLGLETELRLQLFRRRGSRVSEVSQQRRPV